MRWGPPLGRRGAQGLADQGWRLSERNAVEGVRARPRQARAPQGSPKGRSSEGPGRMPPANATPHAPIAQLDKGENMTDILQLQNVESAYGPIKAIRGVSLKVRQG